MTSYPLSHQAVTHPAFSFEAVRYFGTTHAKLISGLLSIKARSEQTRSMRVKNVLLIVLTIVLLGFATGANATPYAFEDMIDTWCGGLDAQYIHDDFTYTHDVNDDVDFLAGDLVTEAYLELDFTNDFTDCHGSILCFQWDFRENVTLIFDADTGTWTEVGEVDNGQHDLVVGIDWINDDGFLDVTLIVWNSVNCADLWLDHSRLYGFADSSSSAPVPEPSSLLLLGAGLLGLAGVTRKRFIK